MATKAAHAQQGGIRERAHLKVEKIIVTSTKTENLGKETDQRVRNEGRRGETSALDKDEF